MSLPPHSEPHNWDIGAYLSVVEQALVVSGEPSDVSAYKTIFKVALNKRPSGMRLRLAQAMGKSPGFISQISNPAYEIPVPVQHLATIFEVCRFSSSEKSAFLKAYYRAHPHRVERGLLRERQLVLRLPDLGSPRRNGRLESLMLDFAAGLVALVQGDG